MNILQLEDYSLTRFHLDFSLPKDEEILVESMELELDYDVLTNRDDPLQRLLKLRIHARELDGKRTPVGHHLQCEIQGRFRIPDDIEAEKREGLIRVNGVSILYSTLRGIVGNMSGSFPGGRFCLPTIYPQSVVESVEARKAKEGKPKAPGKKAAKKKKRKPAKKASKPKQ